MKTTIKIVALLALLWLSTLGARLSAQVGGMPLSGATSLIYTNRLLTTLTSGVTNRLWWTNSARPAFGDTNAIHIYSNATSGQWEWRTAWVDLVATNVNNRATGAWNNAGNPYGSTRYEPRSVSAIAVTPPDLAPTSYNVSADAEGMVVSPADFWQANSSLIAAATAQRATNAPDGIRLLSAGDAVFPLNIPTYTGNPQATHPSVIDCVTNWNGFRYWMAFTPYPPAEHENPSIVSSHDGINWFTPPGLVNPVAGPNEITNYLSIAGLPFPAWFLADTEIIQLTNGAMLLLYKASVKTNSIIYTNATVARISTDGVTWNGPYVCAYTGPTDGEQISPQTVLNDDGTVRVYFNDNSPSYQLYYVDADEWGTNWGTPVACTTSDNAYWHFDLKRVTNGYVMLANHGAGAGAPTTLYLYQSDDGETFTRTSTDALSKSGAYWDALGYYKPDFLYRGNGRWDVYVGSASGDASNNDRWRIGLFRNINLPGGGDTQARTSSVPVVASWESTNYNTTIPGRLTAGVGQIGKLSIGDTIYTPSLFALGPSNEKDQRILWASDGWKWPLRTNSSQLSIVFGDADGSKTGLRWLLRGDGNNDNFLQVGKANTDTAAKLTFSRMNSSGANMDLFVMMADESHFNGSISVRSNTVAATVTATPTTPGQALFWNSNGVVYLLTSGAGSTWTATNKIAP